MLLRLRQVQRLRAQRPRGPQPGHRREDPDRRVQGAEVHRRRGAEEGRQVAFGRRSADRRGGRRVAGARRRVSSRLTTATGFGDRLAGRVQRGDRRSSWGWIPIPPVCGPRRWSWRTGTAAHRPSAAERAARAVAAHCRLVLEAAGEQCVAVKPQVACFERLGAPGWAALRRGDRRRAASAGCSSSPTPSAATSTSPPRAYGQAFFGATPTPFGDGPGPRRRCADGQPAARPRLAGPAGRGGARARRRSVRAGADLQSRAPPTSRTASSPAAGRSATRSPRMVDELGQPGVGRVRAVRHRRRRRRDRARAAGAAAGADAARRVAAARGRRPGRQRPRPGAGVRPRPRRRAGRGLARRSSTPTSGAGGEPARPPLRARRSRRACAS